MEFYLGICETKFNHEEIPSSIELACVSPIKGRSERTRTANRVKVPEGVRVIQDSGAFSDSWVSRLDFCAAWERQEQHAEKYGYASQISHRASYDWLIDETWQDGVRSKKRWTVQDAEIAVDATVAAAEYASKRRGDLGLVLSAQGVNPSQYLDCAKRVIPRLDPTRDKLGLGGWCILGVRRELMPAFRDTVRAVIPYAAKLGIREVHIWGVVYPAGLGVLLWWCDQYGLSLSTDSTSPSMAPVRGEWGYAEWRKKIPRVPTSERGQVRIDHVQATKNYLADLRRTAHYQAGTDAPVQLKLF